MFPSPATYVCSPLPSSGYRGRSLRKPCGSPPSSVLRAHKTARPSFQSPPVSLGGQLLSARGDGELSWVPGESLLEACPELGTPATPARPRDIGRPSAAFRLVNSVGIATSRFSELNLHGLLLCCVRFAPTSHPVNGNTRYRPARSLWPDGTYTRWIPLRSFTVSSSVPPLPNFPSAMTMPAVSSGISTTLLPALEVGDRIARNLFSTSNPGPETDWRDRAGRSRHTPFRPRTKPGGQRNSRRAQEPSPRAMVLCDAWQPPDGLS